MIGPADVEFYHGKLVRELAISMSGLTCEQWEISHAVRPYYMDKAAIIISTLTQFPVELNHLVENINARCNSKSV